MKTRTYTKDVRPMPLLLALQAAGVPVLAVRPPTMPGEPTTIDLDDSADNAAVDQVVAAHDAAALDAQEAQAKSARALVRQTIVAYPGKASPTAAETVAAVKALCLAVAALAREE